MPAAGTQSCQQVFSGGLKLGRPAEIFENFAAVVASQQRRRQILDPGVFQCIQIVLNSQRGLAVTQRPEDATEPEQRCGTHG